jgi:hypothetical protein
VVFDVAARHAQLTSKPRRGPKFMREQIDQLPAKRHVKTLAGLRIGRSEVPCPRMSRALQV